MTWRANRVNAAIVLTEQETGKTVELRDNIPVSWFAETRAIKDLLDSLGPESIPDPLNMPHVLEVLRNVDAWVMRWVQLHPVAYLLYAARCKPCNGSGWQVEAIRLCPVCLGDGMDPEQRDRLNPGNLLGGSQ